MDHTAESDLWNDRREVLFDRGFNGRLGRDDPYKGTGKQIIIKGMARRGIGIRTIARLTVLSSNTVSFYFPYEENLLCQCGTDILHKGWCAWRAMHSPERMAFLRRWAYRESGLLVSTTSPTRSSVAITLRVSNASEEVVTQFDVLKAVRNEIGKVDGELHDDLLQEMYLDVLENRTPLLELGKAVRTKLAGMRGEVSRFNMVSLDDMIPGTDVRMLDTIEADRFHF